MDVIAASMDALQWTKGLVKLDMRCVAMLEPGLLLPQEHPDA